LTRQTAKCSREICTKRTRGLRNKYCSRACRYDRDVFAKPSRSCKHCGSITTNRMYCSRNCASQSKRGPNGLHVLDIGRARASCIWCQKGQIERALGRGIPFCRCIGSYIARWELSSCPPSKEMLYRFNLKKQQCEWCQVAEWRGKPAPLELDHIDGDKSNNKMSNLRILCANCHAQTPTYRIYNTKWYKSRPSSSIGRACDF
jgi:hypothetical protein